MTLDEAIQHAREVYETRNDMCLECRQEHLQLAEWLEELKSLKGLRTPKKLDYDNDESDYHSTIIYNTAFCPDCRREFDVCYDEHCSYCPDCGQALDWERKTE